jgi:hypothetical protein
MPTKKTTTKTTKPPKETPKRLGRTPLPPERVRSDRISIRTYPAIAAKAKRVGTEAVEKAIMGIKE